MTCSQFITIAVRAIGKEAEAQGYSGKHWSDGYYRVAQKYGLIKSGEFGDANKDRAMTREEMAYISMNVLKHNKEYPEKTMPLNNIPDIAEVKNDYNIGAVQFCYSMGVLVGVDDAGNYNPQGVLKRNAGATVAVRLVDASARKTPNFDAKPQQQQQQTPQGTKSWVEGERHGMPQAGDQITSKSGQTFIINEQYGILGVGQDVNIWVGCGVYDVGSSGPDGSTLIKGKICNEVHSYNEWVVLEDKTYPVGLDGEYDGEMYGNYWKWHEGRQAWNWVGCSLAG